MHERRTTNAERIAALETQVRSHGAAIEDLQREEERTRGRLDILENYKTAAEAAKAALSAVKAERTVVDADARAEEAERRARRDRWIFGSLAAGLTALSLLLDHL